jgi:phenylalanyl-tRNA synthetase alpha subunit
MRNVYLLVGFVLMIILSYVLAISKTISLIEENKELQALTETDISPTSELSTLNARLRELDSLKQTISSIDNYNAYLIKNVTEWSQVSQVEVVGMKQLPSDKRTDEVSFEGSFHQLLRLLNIIEQQLNTVGINSVRFERIEDRRTKFVTLQMHVIIQKQYADES